MKCLKLQFLGKIKVLGFPMLGSHCALSPVEPYSEGHFKFLTVSLSKSSSNSTILVAWITLPVMVSGKLWYYFLPLYTFYLVCLAS